MSLLGHITGASDLTALPTTALAVLAQEIRALVIQEVSGAGGHWGPRFPPHAFRGQDLHAHGVDAAIIITAAVLTRLASTHHGKARSKES